MSQPRRRRRRRRRSKSAGQPAAESPARSETPAAAIESSRRRRPRRARGRRRAQPTKSCEEVICDILGPPPARLTTEPDGQTLEGIIGDLQSVWGVPQYPQEYRITVKVAEPKPTAPVKETISPNGITRERAPAAPRVSPQDSADDGRRKRVRRRRRRRRGGPG
jgi:hypothetical protein